MSVPAALLLAEMAVFAVISITIQVRWRLGYKRVPANEDRLTGVAFPVMLITGLWALNAGWPPRWYPALLVSVLLMPAITSGMRFRRRRRWRRQPDPQQHQPAQDLPTDPLARV